MRNQCARDQIQKLIRDWSLGDKAAMTVDAAVVAALDAERPDWPAGAWTTQKVQMWAEGYGRYVHVVRFGDGHLGLTSIPSFHHSRLGIRPHKPTADDPKMCEHCGLIVGAHCDGWFPATVEPTREEVQS